jgi:tRNA threonylcarbamoyladenosine biosynthesis protein TsaE
MLDRISESEQQTGAIARSLAAHLRPGDVLLLNGPLGAGKTRFVQGLAAALGCESAYTSSPTFGLVHEYDGRNPVVHIDAYRLRDVDEFYELGGDELLGSGAVACIEWAARIQAALPADALTVTIEPVGRQTRRLRFESVAGRGAEILREWGPEEGGDASSMRR